MNKSRLQLLYSFSVLIIVPSLLALNTIMLATSVRSDNDKELQSRAELANSVLALSIRDFVTNNQKEIVVEKLVLLTETQNEVRNPAVIVRNDGNYEVFAYTEDDYELFNTDKVQYDIVYSRKWPVAKNVAARTDTGNRTRAWNVASPIIDEDRVIGVVVSDYLTTDNDERFDATLNRSFLIMLGSAIAVVVLLFNHFRFIGYADLLRKQKELNQTMSDFLSVATHELKAPMSIIKGYISNVTDGDFGEVNDSIKEQLNTAIAQTDRLNELVQDLLNVSRIEQGKITISMQNIDVVPIIRSIVNLYQNTASEKQIAIVYEPASEHIWIQADPSRVQEIFTNLIDNAIKYSKEGTVSLSHTQESRYIVTSVRDNGIGMTSEERSRLFQRFYRVKNEKTKGISGTGLGLWIIKQYIEKMSGKITVDSLVGAGSEFRVSLKKGSPQSNSNNNNQQSSQQQEAES